jgi:hypothetical protein
MPFPNEEVTPPVTNIYLVPEDILLLKISGAKVGDLMLISNLNVF